MSDIFQKSCRYQPRIVGYKYRTTATNTGDKKHREAVEENLLDRKFRELESAIFSRIDNHLEETQNSREAIVTKLQKVDLKIDSMMCLQESIMDMRRTICDVENKLADMVEKVNKIDLFTQPSLESYSVNSYSMKPRVPIYNKPDNVGTEVVPSSTISGSVRLQR